MVRKRNKNREPKRVMERTNNGRLKIREKNRGGEGEVERQRTIVIEGCEKTTNSIQEYITHKKDEKM